MKLNNNARTLLYQSTPQFTYFYYIDDKDDTINNWMNQLMRYENQLRPHEYCFFFVEMKKKILIKNFYYAIIFLKNIVLGNHAIFQ